MAKILKMTKSLNDLNKLLDMETIPVNQVVIEAPQNFYSFLHKRNRFYENDVIKTDCKLNTNTNELRTTITSVHNKFEIKKINIDESIIKRKEGRNGEFKEDVAYIEIFKNFKWQKDEFYSKLVTRHIQNAKTLTNNQLACDTNLQLQPDWRLTIGLGGGSVFETSITLHHVYGFPYIPASAVKGVLRSYLITELQGYEANREALLFRNNKEMCDIFGCGEETLYEENGNKQRMTTFYKNCFDEDKSKFENDKLKYRFPNITEKIGDVIFFDAYPCESPNGKIKADIMNPHYPKYYNGNLPPADWQSPIPIIFLTVENLKFQFMIGVRKGVTNFKIGNNSVLNVLIHKEKNIHALEGLGLLLKQAMQNHGIGAKTAVGYGYMKSKE